MPNRLAQETSPYLRQHKDNPVDWYPWGKEALERAKREDKPILLSVGYSACHWCHVMAHESFESQDIARRMNQDFINIKVDREERPDLDQIYQNVAQIFTQGGGWPLTVFLTPDLKPFFGGTYFPQTDQYGRPGFGRVLESLAHAYREKRTDVLENAQKILDTIASLETVPKIEGVFNLDALDFSQVEPALSRLLQGIDWTHGGFGGMPKFPNSMQLTALWRSRELSSHAEFKNDAREAVLLSLTRMASGGVYDQLGGGFHRYSVDQEWMVPHFEKMLYDNALLLKLYAEVVLDPTSGISASVRELYVRTIKQTVAYVMREMTGPEGAFYSAQDADSEGEEGKFFSWTPKALREALKDRPEFTEQDFKLFELRYGVTEAGNFEQGATVLHLARSIAEVAALGGAREAHVRARLIGLESALFIQREKRVKPGLDDKRLTSWNALMVSGLCWAGEALRESGEVDLGDRAVAAALRAFGALFELVCASDGRLAATYQVGPSGGSARFNGYLDDYAFMAAAALDLMRTRHAGGEPTDLAKWSSLAKDWTQRVVRSFGDPSAPGYFFTSDDHERLIQRPKSLQDQAIPSGTAIALTAMLALVEIDPENSNGLREECHKQLAHLLPIVLEQPQGSGEMLSVALAFIKGMVAYSGPKPILARLPGLYRKPGHELVICHRQTCRAWDGVKLDLSVM